MSNPFGNTGQANLNPSSGQPTLGSNPFSNQAPPSNPAPPSGATNSGSDTFQMGQPERKVYKARRRNG